MRKYFMLFVVVMMVSVSSYAITFNVCIENDTDKSFKLGDVVKNYSTFDEDYRIEEDFVLLKPKQKTPVFTVNLSSLLVPNDKEQVSLDGFYFIDDESQEKIPVSWGKQKQTSGTFSPIFSPLSADTGSFETKIIVEGNQNPIYRMCIVKKDSKL